MFNATQISIKLWQIRVAIHFDAPVVSKQQYQLFTLPGFGRIGLGLVSGLEEPVLYHKDFEIVLLVVNKGH